MFDKDVTTVKLRHIRAAALICIKYINTHYLY